MLKKIFGPRVSFGLILLLALMIGLLITSLFTAVQYVAPPSYSLSLANVQSISAKSYLVFDLLTGETLYRYNSTEVLPIASLTKLATAKVFYENNNIFATTSITWSDLSGYGKAGKLSYGETYMYHTLLFPLILESSNDVALVLLRCDSDLITEMNEYAKSLALTNTKYDDTSGMSSSNLSTANDQAVILRDIYLNNKHLFDITGLKYYLSPNKSWINTNPASSMDSFVGGKNGYTDEARQTLAVVFDERLASGNDRLIGYVILGSLNVENDLSLLRNHVKSNARFE